MNATTAAPEERIVTLDIVRGVAVMGILAMNIVAFGMPGAAYMNPTAYGTEGAADMASWLFNFILIDGRMRGLFSFLFGASLLLVVERAVAAGRSGAGVHYPRMAWLLLFGLIHYFLIWWGDILTLYALVGMIAFLFWRTSPKALIITACVLLGVQFLIFGLLAATFAFFAAAAAEPNASAEVARSWAEMQRGMGPYPPAELQQVLDRFRGPWTGIVAHQFELQQLFGPLTSFFMFGWETLAYMLLGMAALKTGFLTGALPAARYRRWMLIGFGIGIPVYALLAWWLVTAEFHVPTIFLAHFTLTVPVRPLMILATAALIILATRRGGALVERIAAAGRAAFTNYLGASILMTLLFYGWGFGLFGHLSRIELWLPVLGAWAIMLLWSKPWLDRFRYGPFEWLWRSLSRGRIEPLRKRPEAAPALA
jgi:uncharacterized protein